MKKLKRKKIFWIKPRFFMQWRSRKTTYAYAKRTRSFTWAKGQFACRWDIVGGLQHKRCYRRTVPVWMCWNSAGFHALCQEGNEVDAEKSRYIKFVTIFVVTSTCDTLYTGKWASSTKLIFYYSGHYFGRKVFEEEYFRYKRSQRMINISFNFLNTIAEQQLYVPLATLFRNAVIRAKVYITSHFPLLYWWATTILLIGGLNICRNSFLFLR